MTQSYKYANKNLIELKAYLKRLPFPLTRQEVQAYCYGPKVLANSCPKSGTNLLIRILSLFPLLVDRWKYSIVRGNLKLPEQFPAIRKGQYVASHLYWSRELVDALNTANIKTLFIIRDLRDVVVSRAYYHTYSLTSHPAYTYLNSLKSDAERLMVAIRGIDKPGMGFCSIGDWARGYTPWLDEPTCLTIRFEELIGSAGGGNDQQQVESVRAIASHLRQELSTNQIHEIASQAFFKKANTFRKGQIGDWSNSFSDVHKQAFKELAGEPLIRLKYANDYDW